MTTTSIRIQLDSAGSHYQPGERLTGRFMVEGTQMRTVRSAELSVLWYTAGKGDEDMAVHHFERLVDDIARPIDLRVPHRFATVLPASPLSYDGHIVKVCWCVRVRLFLPQAQESVAEIAFRLGNVSIEGLGAGGLGPGNEGEEAKADGKP
jgi:hypothetical protein